MIYRTIITDSWRSEYKLGKIDSVKSGWSVRVY